MKIAAFLPNWVGDAVMATPALRALRERYADATIIGILRPYVAGVLEELPWLDRCIYFDPKGPPEARGLAVARALRRERIDLAFLFTNSFRTALAAWLGKCRRRIGYARYGRALLLTDPLAPVRDTRGRLVPFPALDSFRRLVEVAGCAVSSDRLELATASADELNADRLWEKAEFSRFSEVICLNAGAAFGSAKQWPAESFAELARLLIDRRSCGVLVLCGPGERALAQEIATRSGRHGVYSLAAETLSLGLTKACVRRCQLLVTTDSGPRHFAAAFDRPVVTLFGPTHIAWTETRFARAVHLQKKVDCGPCQLRTCPLDHRCMKLLTPEEVLDAAERLLALQGSLHAVR